MTIKKITQLNNKEAKEYFLENENYCTFDIPDYFDFTGILERSDEILESGELKSFIKKYCNEKGENDYDWPKYYDDVNYKCLSNKGSLYSWRPLQLINPFLYVDLINEITNKNNWNEILKKFEYFNKGLVRCCSLALKGEKKHKASEIERWWTDFENLSLKMNLRYEYFFSTDISNCYESLYTHAIEWALIGRESSKESLKERKNLKTYAGNIEQKIRNLTYGQTNGLPQGSKIMDFIAEIVLGYLDIELSKAISEDNILKKKGFEIIRYRDDYRIFTNEVDTGYEILRLIDEILGQVGFSMNESKTCTHGKILFSSLKSEKRDLFNNAPSRYLYQKEAYRLYLFSEKYPGSNYIKSDLNRYYKKLIEEDKFNHVDFEVLISLFVGISINTPDSMSWVATIVSILLSKVVEDSQGEIIKNIHSKFERYPNTTLRQIWLQRISAPIIQNLKYNESLIRRAINKDDNSTIWNFNWLQKEYKDQLLDIPLVSADISTKKPIIQEEEVEKFDLSHPS